MKRPTRDALPTTNFTWLCCWRLLLLLYHFGGHNRVLQEAVCQKKKKNFFVPLFREMRERERERDCVIRWDCWMLSLDQFNFFWVPSSLGCCFIFFITWITGTIPHFYSLLPSWSLSLSLLYIYYIWYLGKCDALSWWWRRQNIYLRSEETSYFVSVTHKGKKKKRKRNEFEIKDDVDLYSYWPIYRFLFLYLSERDSIFLSQYIIGLDFFSDPLFLFVSCFCQTGIVTGDPTAWCRQWCRCFM